MTADVQFAERLLPLDYTWTNVSPNDTLKTLIGTLEAGLRRVDEKKNNIFKKNKKIRGD